MAVLVVNADDFGLTEGTNQAIVDAHRRGVVTSTSLLANGYAFAHAVALAKQTPSLGVGVHLTLTEGPPLTDSLRIFLTANGEFPLSNQPYARALLTGTLPAAAIQREFEAQINRIVTVGITPTHIDGHKYIHLLPVIASIAARVAQQYGIPVMRAPHRLLDAPTRVNRVPGMAVIVILGRLARRAARRYGISIVDRVAGFVDTGHLTATAVRRLLQTPQPGVTELLCHPAYRTEALQQLLARGYRWIAGYDFEAETAAVSDPSLRHDLLHAGWRLSRFADAHAPDAREHPGCTDA